MEERNKIELYRKMRSDFYKKFKSNCTPILQSFEAERNKIKNIITLVVAIVVIFSVIAIGYYIISTGKRSDDTIIPIVIILSGMAAIISLYTKHFENKIKKQIMPIVCECFGDLRWVENPIINHVLYEKSGLITEYYNRTKSDDSFEGSFRDVPLNIDEVEYLQVERRMSSKGGYREHQKTIFKGIIITLQMNKNFDTHTLVRPNTLMKSVNVAGLKHTTLEDVQFEKQYDVFTNDEVEARYLLTPSFMERLSDIRKIFNTSQISCAFYQNKFIIALDVRRDLFKLGSLYKKTDDTKQFFQMYEEIESIVKLIDHFKLDQKIGL